MATDIAKSITANTEKHGCPLVLGTRTNPLNNNTIAELCSSNPTVSSVEGKYDGRFDDAGYYGGGGTNSLAYLVKASYRLDEPGGTRSDRSANSLNLTDNNTVGYTTGKKDSAASFVFANSEYLSVGDSILGDLSPGSIDFSVGFWVYLDSGVTFSSDMFIAGIWNTTGNNREWMFLYTAGDNKIRFSTSSNGTSQSYIATAALSAGTWYNIVGIHDNTGGGKKLYVNNALASSDSNTGVYQGNGDLMMGAFQNNTTFFDGAIDEFNMWHRVLSTSNISEFYNSGDGKHVK